MYYNQSIKSNQKTRTKVTKN